VCTNWLKMYFGGISPPGDIFWLAGLILTHIMGQTLDGHQVSWMEGHRWHEVKECTLTKWYQKMWFYLEHLLMQSDDWQVQKLRLNSIKWWLTLVPAPPPPSFLTFGDISMHQHNQQYQLRRQFTVSTFKNDQIIVTIGRRDGSDMVK
jgi:hypothetical protein